MDPDIPAALPGESKMAAIRTKQDAIKITSNAVSIVLTSVNSHARYHIISIQFFQS
jgi:hypothetical protein